LPLEDKANITVVLVYLLTFLVQKPKSWTGIRWCSCL